MAASRALPMTSQTADCTFVQNRETGLDLYKYGCAHIATLRGPSLFSKNQGRYNYEAKIFPKSGLK